MSVFHSIKTRIWGAHTVDALRSKREKNWLSRLIRARSLGYLYELYDAVSYLEASGIHVHYHLNRPETDCCHRNEFSRVFLESGSNFFPKIRIVAVVAVVAVIATVAAAAVVVAVVAAAVVVAAAAVVATVAAAAVVVAVLVAAAVFCERESKEVRQQRTKAFGLFGISAAVIILLLEPWLRLERLMN